MTGPDEPIRIEIGGQPIEIREMHPGIFNAFDEAGERLAIAAHQGDDWWLGCRIGGARRHFHADGVETATRQLLT